METLAALLRHLARPPSSMSMERSSSSGSVSSAAASAAAESARSALDSLQVSGSALVPDSPFALSTMRATTSAGALSDMGGSTANGATSTSAPPALHLDSSSGAAGSLAAFVEAEMRDLSSEAFGRFMDEVYAKVFAMVSSANPYERLGGVRAIDELVDVELLGENATKCSRFANYLRELIRHAPEPAMAMEVSRTFGHLIRNGGVQLAEVVELEIEQALTWLRDGAGGASAAGSAASPAPPSTPPAHRPGAGGSSSSATDHRRLTAVMMLKELADNAPVVFNVHVPVFVSAIWFALRDPRRDVREHASLALRSCLCVVEARETRHRMQWYHQLYEETRVGLLVGVDEYHGGTVGRASSPMDAAVHASLVTAGELLMHAGEFMVARYREVAEAALAHRASRNRDVRLAVMALLPRLARFSPERFCANYLAATLEFLFGKDGPLRNATALGGNADLRGAAYTTIGELAQALSSGGLAARLTPHLVELNALCREGIAPPRRGRACPEALLCSGRLARALGPPWEPHATELIEPMFSSGSLTAELVLSLRNTCQALPSLLPRVRLRLLDLLSLILAKRPYRRAVLTAMGLEGSDSNGSNGSNGTTAFANGHSHGKGSNGSSNGGNRHHQQQNAGKGGGDYASESGEIMGVGETTSGLVQLALHTLGDFSLAGAAVEARCLLEFVRVYVTPYLQSEDVVSRQHAALTCSSLLERHGARPHSGPTAMAAGGSIDAWAPADVVHASIDGIRRSGEFAGWPNGSFGGTLHAPPPSLPAVSALREASLRSGGLRRVQSMALLAQTDDGQRRAHHRKRDRVEAVPRLSGARAQALVEAICGRLVVSAVADPDVSVRRVLLWSLRRGGPAVMEALASADCMRALFAALNDECPRCRLYAIELVGALSLANPAYAQPALRQHLLQLLGDLEHAADGKQREESARLLGALICATPRISVPYAGPVLRCLVSKLNDCLPHQTKSAGGAGAGERKVMKGRRRRAGGGGVVASVLCALGDLSRVAGAAVRPRVDDILPLVLEALQDSGAVGRRDAAVVALGMIVESTGYVLAPYFDYPQLLGVLLRALCESGSLGTKREVVRVIGVIGALDPFSHKQNRARLQGEGQLSLAGVRGVRVAGGDGGGAGLVGGGDAIAVAGNGIGGTESEDEPPPSGTLPPEEYYPTVAIGCLLRTLRDPSMASNHLMVVRSLMYVFQALGMSGVQYLGKAMPVLFHLARQGDSSMREFMLQQLTLLVGVAKQHIRRHLAAMVELIHDTWPDLDSFGGGGPSSAGDKNGVRSNSDGASDRGSSSDGAGARTLAGTGQPSMLALRILHLLEALSVNVGDDLRAHLPSLLPGVVALLSGIERGDVASHELVPQALHTLETFGGAIDDQLPIVLPALMRLAVPGASSAPVPRSTQHNALATLARLATKVSVTGHVSAILHPLSRALRENPPDETGRLVLEAVVAVGTALGPDVAPFLPMLRRSLAVAGVSYVPFEELAGKTLTRVALPGGILGAWSPTGGLVPTQPRPFGAALQHLRAEDIAGIEGEQAAAAHRAAAAAAAAATKAAQEQQNASTDATGVRLTVKEGVLRRASREPEPRASRMLHACAAPASRRARALCASIRLVLERSVRA